MLLYPLLFILLAGCSLLERHEEKDASDPTQVEALRFSYAERLTTYDSIKDQQTGWPSALDCDGTLWAGLACAAGVPDVKIELAELTPGVIGRRPGSDCHASDLDGDGKPDSKSTTSQDMAMGYMWCLWRSKNLPATKRFADACQARPLAFEDLPACILGEPYPEMAARVVLRPNGMGLLGRLLYNVSAGSDARPWRNTPSLYLPVLEDYEKHLQALGIALHGELDEQSADAVPASALYKLDINGQMLERLQELTSANPDDWTFQAVYSVYTGNYQPAIEILLRDPLACPTYARSSEVNCVVSWLFAARLVLNRYPVTVE